MGFNYELIEFNKYLKISFWVFVFEENLMGCFFFKLLKYNIYFFYGDCNIY